MYILKYVHERTTILMLVPAKFLYMVNTQSVHHCLDCWLHLTHAVYCCDITHNCIDEDMGHRILVLQQRRKL